jgi:hypothetical protein
VMSRDAVRFLQCALAAAPYDQPFGAMSFTATIPVQAAPADTGASLAWAGIPGSAITAGH